MDNAGHTVPEHSAYPDLLSADAVLQLSEAALVGGILRLLVHKVRLLGAVMHPAVIVLQELISKIEAAELGENKRRLPTMREAIWLFIHHMGGQANFEAFLDAICQLEAKDDYRSVNTMHEASEWGEKLQEQIRGRKR